MLPWYSSLFFDSNKYILHRFSYKYIPLHFNSLSTLLYIWFFPWSRLLLQYRSLKKKKKKVSWTYIPLLSRTHAMHLHMYGDTRKAWVLKIIPYSEMHLPPLHPPPTHTHTHFDLYTHCPHTHFPNNGWDKSLWDLPPHLWAASHTVPIRLSPDTLRCKNNTAALKKAPGERRRSSQKHFCLFLMGHPHEPGRGVFVTNPRGENISIDCHDWLICCQEQKYTLLRLNYPPNKKNKKTRPGKTTQNLCQWMDENEKFGKLWKTHLFADSETRSQKIPYVCVDIQYEAARLA